MNQIQVMYHSSIKIKTQEKLIYIDPYHIQEETHDADLIFTTHSHYDHFSKEDIIKIKKETTKIITVESSKKEAEELVGNENVVIVKPYEERNIDEISFTTYPAYNKQKPFHPKENNWVGYKLNCNGETIYIAGDTDALEELEKIQCDIALLPIGGTYTMNAEEAANLANNMQIKKVIPTHYGAIVGSKQDAETLKELVTKAEVEIQI